MKKAIVYLLGFLMLVGIVFATCGETMSLSSSGSSLTITASGVSGNWGSSIELSASGCSFPSGASTYKSVMLSEDGTTKTITVTGSCTVTGNYKFGTCAIKDFNSVTMGGSPSCTYSEWSPSTCPASCTQTRTVTSGTGCTGILSQPCIGGSCTCTPTSWTPDPSTQCGSFTQTSTPCGTTRTATGTKTGCGTPPTFDVCAWTTWNKWTWFGDGSECGTAYVMVIGGIVLVVILSKLGG